MSEWIPVGERLPVPYSTTEVLVFRTVAPDVPPVSVGYYTGETGSLWVLQDELYRDKITHWMPLPEPPA